jgi:hypothetical protein
MARGGEGIDRHHDKVLDAVHNERRLLDLAGHGAPEFGGPGIVVATTC